MDLLQGEGDRFVVIDVETTGVLNSDRIVEVGVVTLSPNGTVVDEWDTLVNPERDVGPTHIHRINASMVSAAPTFPEIASALAERLAGGVLVAHNLPFDARMLVSEFRRIDGTLEPGRGICTLQLYRMKLPEACRRHRVRLDHAHRALADARAVARLLRQGGASMPLGGRPAFVELTNAEFNPRTLRRDISEESTGSEMPYLARLADRAHHYGEHGPALVYMDLLDWAISDLVLTDLERTQLAELAIDVGLSAEQVHSTHERYVRSLVAAARRDGVVDAHELEILNAAAGELGVDLTRLAPELSTGNDAADGVLIERGARVCFTGSATNPDGSKLDRGTLEFMADEMGLVPVSDVSKRGCDLVVAADPASQSGKAKKARRWGIPVVAVSDFVQADSGDVIPQR